jgi:hypothetical protein
VTKKNKNQYFSNNQKFRPKRKAGTNYSFANQKEKGIEGNQT